ncbi:MAG: DUF3027 domain-containing protein [Pseudolysinimonas sp.]
MTVVTAEEREAIARSALAEITPAGTFGDFIDETHEGEGVYTLLFAATMGGYPGWHWTVSVAVLPDSAPTVLEAELLPGDGSLLAPEWVPWSDRLKAGEDLDALAEIVGSDDDDLDDDLDDDDLDDDHGDDPTDGIDFESADLESGLLAVGEDEQDEPEAETDDDGPEPPAAAPVKKRRQKKQHADEGDQPED